jgi:hypothetical protein
MGQAKINSEAIETISRETVNAQLRSVAVTCEKLVHEKSGGYQYYVAIEIPKSRIGSEFITRFEALPLSDGTFDYLSFKKVFNNELQLAGKD